MKRNPVEFATVWNSASSLKEASSILGSKTTISGYACFLRRGGMELKRFSNLEPRKQLPRPWIPLTRNKAVLVDNEDYDELIQHTWFLLKTEHNVYAVRRLKSMGPFLLMHRVIMKAPDGCSVDHINRDGLDNRRENLRLCTQSENAINSKLSRKNTSGFKGVRRVVWNGTPLIVARIEYHHKTIHIGCFQDASEAARAYDAKAVELFGEFALTNAMLGLLPPTSTQSKPCSVARASEEA